MRRRIKTIILVTVIVLLTGLVVFHEILLPFQIQKINQIIEEGDHTKLEHHIKWNRSLITNWPFVSTFLAAFTDSIPLRSPLQTACRKDDSVAVGILLKYGADPNFVPFFQHLQNAPLCFASAQGNLAMVQTLLEHGANAPMQGSYAMVDYLQYRMNCRKNGNPLLIEEFHKFLHLLEDHGYVLPTQSSLGYTPLEYAALYGDVEVMQVLLSDFALDASAQSYKGQTILHIRIASSWQEVTTEDVAIILAFGTDPAIVDLEGKSAYDYAVEKGYEEIAQLLRKT